MDVTASDAVGTAHSKTQSAASRLREILRSFDKLPPLDREFQKVEHLLSGALCDIRLARQMLSSDWTDTTFVGRWSRVDDEAKPR